MTGSPPRSPNRPARVAGRKPQQSSQARFRGRATAVRKRRLRLVLVVAMVAALVAGAVWLVGFSSVLAADSVRVEGAADEDAAEVLEVAAVPMGAPLARVDTGAIERRVEQDVTFVKAATAHRAWPNTVVVEVVPRTALLAVKGPQEFGSTQVSLVDEEGVSFRDVDSAPPGLPAVDRSTDSEISKDGLLAVIDVLRLLSEQQRASVGDLRVSGYDQVSFKLGKVQVVWGGRTEGAKKLAVLDALLRTNPSVVDVSAADTPITR